MTLVAAFKSTLEETQKAQLLLHVVDAGAFDRQGKKQQVNEVLESHGQKPNQFQSIVPVGERAFSQIYRDGMAID